MTKRKIQYWVIPPQANCEFVACMENVLDIYAKPYNKSVPVICMDEQPIQFFKETRIPIPATKHHARRVDYEYERAGTASTGFSTIWSTARRSRSAIDSKSPTLSVLGS